MSTVGILGVLASFAALGVGWSQPTIRQILVSLLLLVTHFTASFYYYQYSLDQVADAYGYYFLGYLWGPLTWGLGTTFVLKLVETMRVTYSASYLDCFIFFQSIGFLGIMILLRVFREIEERVGVQYQSGYAGLLFLPSVNFWTASIGKDAPLFLAISLCVWSLLRLKRRILWLCIAVTIMILFRAHIALMAASALAAAALFEPSIGLGRKSGLLVIALLGMWIATGAVQSSLGVDVTNPSDITNFLAQKNDIYAGVAGTTSLGSASFFLRVISLLFRPLFFDAHGAMGMIASVENVAGIIAMIFVVCRWRDLLELARKVLFIRFVLLFALILLFSLSLVYYNVGLGLRQRTMAFPMIFSVLVALWSLRRKRHVMSHPSSLIVNDAAPATGLRGIP